MAELGAAFRGTKGTGGSEGSGIERCSSYLLRHNCFAYLSINRFQKKDTQRIVPKIISAITN